MDAEIRLEEGKLLLFRRNGLWQARIYTGARRYLWRSLKTANEAEARKAGIRLFYQTETKLAEGLPIRHRTLNSVIDEYIEWRETDNKLGKQAKRGGSIKFTQDAMLRQIKRVAKFWREYAGQRSIDNIDDGVLGDYVPWRKTYYHDMPELPKNARLNPTDKTLQWEIMLGKAFVKYAHGKGYRGTKPLPTFTFVPKTKRVRPAVRLADFELMIVKLQAELDEPSPPRRQQMRQLMRDYVLLLGFSGMRVGELNSLRLRDIEALKDDAGRETYKFMVQGKTGERGVVAHIDAREIINSILARRPNADGDELLFTMPDGSKIITLADQFKEFLKRNGIEGDGRGRTYTLYSLRHFYAVRALSRDVPIYDVSRNMGASVQIIEQYYGRDATPASRARKLGGEERQYSRPRSEIDLSPEQKAKRAERQKLKRDAKRVLTKAR
jgi:integrase